jgi:pimeloyl-ACP methyl ester carboxylesterase
MTLDAWRQSGQYFEYRRHRVFYHDAGHQRGDNVLFCLHGFPTASWDWHRLWPRLCERFRVIAVDMLGFGFSDKPRDYSYSLMDQASLCEALLAHLDLDAVHVLAHDYGDTVAMELLARYEERLRQNDARLLILSACLLNGGIFPGAIHPLFIQRLLQGPFGRIVGQLISEDRFRKNLSAVFGPDTQPSDEDLRAFWQLVQYNDGVRVAHRLSRYQHERLTHRLRWTGALQRTPVPLRLIAGLADPVSGPDMVAHFRETIPEPDVVTLDGIGHYPQLEAPDAVWDAHHAFVHRIN